MSHFSIKQEVLHVENVPLTHIAKQFGTPTYVYSATAFIDNFSAYSKVCVGHDALICFSVKSNSNLAILNLLHQYGSGFDIVSGGELLRVIAAGGDPKKVIFSGVGKTINEIRLALSHDILCFNVESISELQRINAIAQEMGKRAPISIRVNPNIDAKTHPYISTGLKTTKFGIAFEEAIETYRIAKNLSHLEILGIDCHIGSQLLDDAPLLEALDKLIELIDQLETENIVIHHLDIGGGIGISYDTERPVAIQDYVQRLFHKIDTWRSKTYQGRPIKILFEPGRSIAGTSGILLTEVQYLKYNDSKNFAIVDAAMNDLMRPTMYQAWHKVQEVSTSAHSPSQIYDIVGPVCESGDWLAKDRSLSIEQGSLLAIMSAGAYGMTMASNYNSRGRAAEILVSDDQAYLIRQREDPKDLFMHEYIPTIYKSN